MNEPTCPKKLCKDLCTSPWQGLGYICRQMIMDRSRKKRNKRLEPPERNYIQGCGIGAQPIVQKKDLTTYPHVK